MAKIARALQKLFGSTGATTEFGVFGSDSEGSAATTKDPALIQSLATYLRGLYGSTANATQPPRIQDLNALYYLFSRQIAYGFQAGVPEWIATENYYANASVVLGSNGKIYISKTGTDGSPNINNDPTTDTGTNWRYVWTNDVFSAFPLSDLSRVMAINGDGIPMFPDNVAGRTYYQDAFATVDSWTATGGTASVAGGFLLMSYTGTSGKISRTFTAFTGKLIRAVVKTNVTGTVNLYGTVGGVADTLITSVSVLAGISTAIDAYVAGAVTVLYFTITSPVSGNILYVDAIYIGSGLYDTPVYDKACCNRATNNGVFPVPGPRGLAMSFNGAQSLQFDNPVIGTTGTIAFKFKLGLLGVIQRIMSNRNASTGFNGVSISLSAGNTFQFVAAGSSSVQLVDMPKIFSELVDWHSCVVTFSGSQISYSLDNAILSTVAQTVQIGQSTTSLFISQFVSGLAQNYTGLLADPRIEARLWTQDDVTRYHNGDDMVDSQQKSSTGVPHSLAVYGADGALRAHNGALVHDSSNDFSWDLVIDSNAKLLQWAASGTYEKVLIKKGTWTLAEGGVDLTARGTKLVVGEPGSKLVFSAVTSSGGLYYTTLPTTKDYRMDCVSVEANSPVPRTAIAFYRCINMKYCIGLATTTGDNQYAYAFLACKNLLYCEGTGVSLGALAGSNYGFGKGLASCDYLVGCIGKGSGGTGSGSEGIGISDGTNVTQCVGIGVTGYLTYGFFQSKKCQQNIATGATAKYFTSYADSGTSYPCADTPNGGFNS
jgi:hypothetical protein